MGRLSSLFVIALAGCSSAEEPPPAPAPTLDFERGGPSPVVVAEGTVEVDGCSTYYTSYVPSDVAPAPLIVLGHGFARTQARMADLAAHLASFGVRVVTPQFCALSASNVDHEANGRLAAELSRSLGGGAPVVHAGYSAGGLAALLAATEDPATVAVLALDWVDADGLGEAAAASLSVPVLGLLGEPSACNAEQNGAFLFGAEGRWGATLTGATHCDFEAPTDALCEGLCGGVSDAAARVPTVAAAFVAWQTGIDATGRAWAAPDGAEWQRWVDDGTLRPVTP